MRDWFWCLESIYAKTDLYFELRWGFTIGSRD